MFNKNNTQWNCYEKIIWYMYQFAFFKEAMNDIAQIGQRTDAMNSKVINMESRIENIAESIDSNFADL